MSKKRENAEEGRLKEIDRKEYREKKKKLRKAGYLAKLFVAVFILTVAFTCLSQIALTGAGIAVSVIVIVVIAFIGVAFDVVGVAVTGGDEAPFNAMASRKIKGAKRGAGMIKNADKVASICNDVVGDMSGIISGAAGSALSVSVAAGFENEVWKFLFPIIITAVIATLVVVGKAAGKSFAIRHSNEIVFAVARFITFFRKEK